MFTILGGDGQEYGPASIEQVRSWIAAGRANLDTQAKFAGSDEWRRLGDYMEFGAPGDLPPVLGSDAAHDGTLAERWRRLLGAVIDGGLESLCWMPTSLALMHSVGDLTDAGQLSFTELMEQANRALPLSFPYLGILVLLQAMLLTLRSQSVGNMLVRTRIVRVSDGSPAGFLRAFLLRGFLARVVRHVPLFGAVFWLVDTCYIFRDDKRCLHDLIAGTKVVNV